MYELYPVAPEHKAVKMELPDWFDVFKAVCGCAQDALGWGLPEPWVHAELYAELNRRVASSGWTPFSTEVPYVTVYPVQLPKKANRDWKVEGAVKWVDLCLQSKTCNAWCWFEFKVRHTRDSDQQQKAARQARDAFRKDVVALMGFDARLTANTWANPDNYTKAYYFKDLLGPHIDNLRLGQHHFVAAFLQLRGEFNLPIWDEKVLMEQIRKWFSYRNKQTGHQRTCPKINIAASPESLVRNHSLLVCQWSLSS